MRSAEIREKFLDYFKSKGHTVVPSSSLLPTDPSVLFTTAGMQQFKPYYTGAADPLKDFGSFNVVSIQKSMRTSDIDEVGDESHLTFFEMLGNFSFGGYWKKQAILYAYEFITQEMGLTIDYVTVFGGNEAVPRDDESAEIWKALDPNLKVVDGDVHDNFWGPTGAEGPCGPTTEIYVNGTEIWNIVFNEFFYPGTREELLSGNSDKKLEPLKTQGIDTGMGLERLAMVVQKKDNIFETDLFQPLIQILPEDTIPDRVHRIIVDHSRAIAFLISDGVTPSNKEQGYVLRRLMRRVIVQCHTNGIEIEAINNMFEKIVELYGKNYPELHITKIKSVFSAENEKFQKTFDEGLIHLNKMMQEIEQSDQGVTALGNRWFGRKYELKDLGRVFFDLYQNFGFPFESILEILKEKGFVTKEGKLDVLNLDEDQVRQAFNEAQKKHQERSRAGAEKKFGGHGLKEGESAAGDADETKKKTRLHTATHIVVAALEKVLGEPLKQAGADINLERLRFDFAFPRKVTPEELQQAEQIANQAVADDLEVWNEELPLEEAFASGAHGAFAHKYPPRVKVYTIGPKDNYFSREICGGPHVTHTAEVGHIKIVKEESVSGGNRRIRAIID
jgi:alanyl-tRNA synthetase